MLNKEIANTSEMFKRTDYNTKNTNILIKIPSVTGLVTIAVLNTKRTQVNPNQPGRGRKSPLKYFSS